MTAVVYRPEEWHDYFVMVGGAAAVLTGLVFVAMSLNVGAIASDATHRYRAIGTLTGITAIFAVCALALMGGQGHRAVGLEWFLVASVATIVYFYGYVQAIRLGGDQRWLHAGRVVATGFIFAAELVGAALFTAGLSAGLYIAAATMVALLSFSISGAWLLIIGASVSADD